MPHRQALTRNRSRPSWRSFRYVGQTGGRPPAPSLLRPRRRGRRGRRGVRPFDRRFLMVQDRFRRWNRRRKRSPGSVRPGLCWPTHRVVGLLSRRQGAFPPFFRNHDSRRDKFLTESVICVFYRNPCRHPGRLENAALTIDCGWRAALMYPVGAWWKQSWILHRRKRLSGLNPRNVDIHQAHHTGQFLEGFVHNGNSLVGRKRVILDIVPP